MNFTLTTKYQHSKKCSDGKKRSFMLYFLNGVEILRQKIPFEKDYEFGYQNHTRFEDIYFLNGKIHQTRKKFDKPARNVHYPVSKKKLQQFDIPVGLAIFVTKRDV